MTALDWIAVAALLFLLPIPIFWLLVHPFAGYWRKRSKSAAYLSTLGVAIVIGTAVLYCFREPLLTSGEPAGWAVAVGVALMLLAAVVFARVERELGAARLLGKVELSGGGELRTAGFYSHIRHPSYAAQMCLMLGACLLAGTRAIWLVGAVWLALQLVMIRFEERELRARFGEAYEEYRRRVPAFFPRF